MRTLRLHRPAIGLDFDTSFSSFDGPANDNRERHSNIISEIRALVQGHEKERIASKLGLAEIQSDILSLASAERLDDTKREAQLTSLATKLIALVSEQDRGDRQVKVIKSLYFTELKQRQSDIQDSHSGTLEWLFDKSRTTFVDWLESQNGIYWVKGLVRWLGGPYIY